MEGTTKLLLIMVAINIFLWLVQGAITEINPEDSQIFFDEDNSPISHYLTEDGYGNFSRDVMPELSTGVTPDTGNFFTDTISSIKNWFQEKLAPVNFVLDFFTAPTDFMKTLEFPSDIALAFGILWYIMGVFLFVMLIFGRGST